MISLVWYAILSFIITYWSCPIIIKYLTKIGLNVRDMGKYHQSSVPISGGLVVLIGTFCSLMVYVFISTFVDRNSNIAPILASIASITIVTFIGFMDDLLVKFTHDQYVGLQRWQKPLLTLPAVIPLMAIKAGTSTMILPIFGPVDFGILYPLVLVPIGFLGASNMVNLLEGYNGIAAGMGIFYTLSLAFYSLLNNSVDGAVIGFAVCGALVAFFRFNFVPAKVLPGDSLTYLLGGTIATIAIVANIEKAAMIISIPFFIEVVLKLRGGLTKQSYGIALSNGKIRSRYEKVYSLPHFLTRTGRYTEKQVVLAMIGTSAFFSTLPWILWLFHNFIN